MCKDDELLCQLLLCRRRQRFEFGAEGVELKSEIFSLNVLIDENVLEELSADLSSQTHFFREWTQLLWEGCEGL